MVMLQFKGQGDNDMKPDEIIQRLVILEVENKSLKGEVLELKDEVIELKKNISYYDRLAAKWGGVCMGAIAFGAILGGGFDKIKDKLISLFP